MATSPVTTKAVQHRSSAAGKAFAWFAFFGMITLALCLLIIPYHAHPRYYIGLGLFAILAGGMVSYVSENRA